MSLLVELQGIGKSFFTEEMETRAVHDVNLSIEAGEFVALSGPSGCGKSTLLSILGLLDSPSAGTYQLTGQDVSSLSREMRARIRCEKIGFVFQAFNLISDLTVEENVMLPLTYKSTEGGELKDRVAAVLDKVEMSHRAKHYPYQLSGGQQQRVAISRALVSAPAIIFADEPTGNLDSHNAGVVMELLEQIHGEGGTVCIVTHDPNVSQRATRQLHMLDGHLTEPARQPALAQGAG